LYIAVTSSPPRDHQDSLLPGDSFLVSRIRMMISLVELTSASATKMEKKTRNMLLYRHSSAIQE
jgi:hypothetical protein